MDAFEKVKPEIYKEFALRISYEGFSSGKEKVMAYCRREWDDNIIAIPDFCFLNWKESGVDDYEMCWRSIVDASKIPPVYSTLFWIGNTQTHPTRRMLCEQVKKIEGLRRTAWDGNTRMEKLSRQKFVSLVDHTKYKYLIDIQGIGYSGRTKMLMFSGRPLFLVDRPWKEYWYESVVPFEHYIPVKQDLSDLVEKLDWAESHPTEVAHIAENAQQFAMSHLRREDALGYFQKQ